MFVAAASQGFTPLVLLIGGGDPILQRPAAACLFNATANDLGAPTAIEATGGLAALSEALLYAEGEPRRRAVTPHTPPPPPPPASAVATTRLSVLLREHA